MTTEVEAEPAFPVQFDDDSWQRGMSLRDYFAAKEMQAYITSQIDMTSEHVAYDAEETVAKIAYQFADAMLAEREKHHD